MGLFGKEERGSFKVEKIGAGSLTVPLRSVPKWVRAEFTHHHHNHPACHPTSADSVLATVHGKGILISWTITAPRTIHWTAKLK